MSGTILNGSYNHVALVKCGATLVRDNGDGTTYVEPAGLDISGYKTALLDIPVLAKKTAVKVEALRRIIALIPSGDANNYIIKEMNLLMQAVALVDKQAQGVVLTADEQATLTAYRNMKSGIDAIRSASNLIEQDIAASQDPATFDVAGSDRWPK